MATQPLSDHEVLSAIQADLASQSSSTRPYLRYFTLEAWYNLGNTPVLITADWERAALIKMLNFLSTGPAIVQPTPIDAGKFIYRVDMRQLNWTAAAWDNLKATDPYFNPSELPSELATAASQTVRADWFVSNIPNSSVDAYYVFLGIDSDDPTIDAKNGVDRFGDMARGAPATVRGGVSVSGTENFNRILSWHETTAFGSGAKGSGHLFKSYNFADDLGDHNIFSHPYEPTVNNPNVGSNANYDFTFADSDNIATLPNGLNLYYTTEGPNSGLADPNSVAGKVQNNASAGAPFPGPTFCFQCHDTVTNQIPFTDQVHDTIANDRSGTFPSNMRNLILGMYDQQAMAKEQAASGARFGQAMAELNLPVKESVGATTESCNVVLGAYATVLQVGLAAAELGVSPTELVTKIRNGSRTLGATLGTLLVEDSSGVPNGSIRRDVWEANYNTVRGILFPADKVTPPPTTTGTPDAGTTGSTPPAATPDAGPQGTAGGTGSTGTGETDGGMADAGEPTVSDAGASDVTGPADAGIPPDSDAGVTTPPATTGSTAPSATVN